MQAEMRPSKRPGRSPSSRRQFIQHSLLLAGLGAGTGDLFPFQGQEFDPDRREQPLLSAPVTVPQDFVGIHAHRWPAGNPLSPAPAYGFGAVRSHDFDGAAWNRIHTAPNTFDWSKLDRWVAVHAAAKRTLIYTVYGTPAWLAASTEHADPYGRPGGAEPPRDLLPLAEFIRTLLQRYNGDGNRRISLVETWNEPHFVRNYQDFWWGSAEQLVAMGRVIHTSVKQIDPDIRVLSPGFVSNLAGALSLAAPSLADAQSSSLFQYLTAPDGHGATGSRWCNGIAFHCYNSPLHGTNAGFSSEIVRLKKLLALMNLPLPLFDTEFGFLQPNAFHELTVLQQASALRRCAAIQAGLGVQGMYFYSHDDPFVGNPSLHPEVGQAIGDVHGMIAGKTLKQVAMLPDGGVRVTTTERTFTW